MRLFTSAKMAAMASLMMLNSAILYNKGPRKRSLSDLQDEEKMVKKRKKILDKWELVC